MSTVASSENDNAILLLTNSLDYHLDTLRESIVKLETTSSVFLKSRSAEGDCKASSLGVASNRSKLVDVLEDLIAKTMQLDSDVQTLIKRVDV